MDCWTKPELEKIDFEQLIPNFENCKTLYTKCDYKLEECVHEQLLKLEAQFKHHNKLVNKEMEIQNDLSDRLWVLSQRYLLLTNAGVCVKLYPEIVSIPTEERILCEFYEKKRLLNLSNCRISASLEVIRENISELHKRLTKLDNTVESIFILGNSSNKPLAYSVDIVNNLYNYYFNTMSKLFSWSQLIDPGDSGAIEDYIIQAKPSEDYENYFTFNAPGCKCLRTKRNKAIVEH